MRIVIDTNCLIQSVGIHSPYRSVWDSVLQGTHTLCVTNEILEEYEEILQIFFRPGFAENIINTIIECSFVEFVTPYYHFNLIQADPDDNKFVDCAICADAKYIVTNDKHYNILKTIQFPKVDIISLKDFVKSDVR